MNTDIKKRVKKAGQLPGTPVYTGNHLDVIPMITITSYNSQELYEYVNSEVNNKQITALENYITWVHVEGLRDVNLIKQIAKTYKLHLLTIEDILNVSQRSKIEDFDNYIFITLKMLSWSHKLNKMYTEQLSLVIGENFVLSFS